MGLSPASKLTMNMYRSYLVRLWQSDEQGLWRASVQCIQTGHTRFFGNIEQLMAFLQAQMVDTSQQVESNEHNAD